ncbi:spondin domain-containing protein [Elizabethkingia meningoseptica]|uniref:spondin domain-containing protein n=1 Tax=Elizabethkingia meningoseptica TaxID=238 RepID=UPI0022F18241|nr:spondin domain-containing protein [Elizabethkingia meningoseptica]EJK5330354.1 spondin domain-containing protein [Elizabethkingia meningoseptica]MDE5469680.1 spondin domain-containing protein [Elizabethkingia meningoseptica]MDE5476598.1 spondin domain-containing protein [Elizabethkingia meningoseptica]MDE5479853.1 spondin domain-containing protein [Elizabethkingia meningoseptica]MDE5486917.1 spondin domain-containing protein [Elizabethkingia meningoseptica]
MKKMLLSAIVMAATSGTLISCNDSNNDMMSQPQPGTFTVENVIKTKDFVQSGSFKGIGSAAVPLPVVLPGQSVSFKFNAGKGQRLMFATMYGASKDWFFAPENPGIKLYNDNGTAITGDISSQIRLWDNGSKNNTTGNPESNPIAMVPNVDASKLMQLNLAYDDAKSEFTITITNTSGGSMNETPFSPGVWAVSNILGGKLLNEMPFYKPGEKSNPEITAIAESGDNTSLAAKTTSNTGIITGLSPVLVVVYKGDTNPIYQLGAKDMGMGLKDIAQKGNPAKLKDALTKPGVSVYVLGNAPIAPGAKVSANITTTPGDKIAYVTMFGYSNDWFYANENEISANMKGDLTAKTALFDDGTGVDQYPGAGNKQALFGGTPAPEDQNIMKVGNSFPVPQVSSVIKVTYQ